jgi:teichuronic acid biosynthesis glycosyltransferase TuaC
LRILTLSTVYPNPREPGLGLFVRRRVQHVAEHAEEKVICPIPVFNYGGHAMAGRSVPGSHWEGQVEVLYPRWFYPPLGGALNAIFLFLQVRGLVAKLHKNFGFEIIDAHFGHPEGVAAALLARSLGCPFTVTLRGSEQLHRQHRVRRAWMGWALRQASRVIAVSDRLKQLAIGLGADPARVAVIPNGVETEVFQPLNREAIRAEYGLDPQTRLIVSAGHLIELKGHHRIVRALASLRDQGLQATLFIAGGQGRGGDYESRLRQEIAELGLNGHVRLLGHLPPEALARLFNAADVFCLASTREGWPNVLNEALACGTPAVATDVGAVPDMIPSEKYGFIVPPGSEGLPVALRRALETNWNRAEIAAWGQKRSWQQVASEVVREMSESCEEFYGAQKQRSPVGVA